MPYVRRFNHRGALSASRNRICTLSRPGHLYDLPVEALSGKVARIICDVYRPDANPRATHAMSCAMRLKTPGNWATTSTSVPNANFSSSRPMTTAIPPPKTIDRGSYFELGPVDKGEEARRDICVILEDMGFEIEASHHECARPA